MKAEGGSNSRYHPEWTMFTRDDADGAHASWGANCGPGALAAVMGMHINEVRRHLADFDRKRYTNPLMMYAALRSLRARWSKCKGWPRLGLVRVQWEGPWTAPGVPMRARYRRTHWIGSRLHDGQLWIFDINCMEVGGWVVLEEWHGSVVPWLLQQIEPKADGHYHTTHHLEVQR